MDFGGLLLLGLLWLVFGALGRRKSNDGERSGTRLPLPPTQGRDPTQREGGRLESLLRELERALEQGSTAGQRRPLPLPGKAPGRVGRPADAPLPSAEDFEERESLEVEEQVVSLEGQVTRPTRPHLSQDEGAEGLVAKRIAAADARSGALTKTDHATFDRRIRAEAPDATAVRSLSAEELRRAVVWREVLGPPVSLRDELS